MVSPACASAFLAAPIKTKYSGFAAPISPYSVNSVALSCLTAALEDEDYLRWYTVEAPDIATALRIGVAPPWRPVLALSSQLRAGRILAICIANSWTAMRTRGVLVRDRSTDPGCDGCVRITIGTREQTEQGIAALEQSLAEIGWSR